MTGPATGRATGPGSGATGPASGATGGATTGPTTGLTTGTTTGSGLSALTERRLFLLTTIAVLILDVATKLAVYNSMSLGRSIPVLGDVLRLTYVHNPGAAFSLFRGSRWFFIVVSSLSALVVVILATGERHRSRAMQVSFGLILGGALGNLIDRLWLGVVIDFIEMGIGTHRWPVYNVADAAVTCGVILLGITLLRQKPEAPAGDRDEDRSESGASLSG